TATSTTSAPRRPPASLVTDGSPPLDTKVQYPTRVRPRTVMYEEDAACRDSKLQPERRRLFGSRRKVMSFSMFVTWVLLGVLGGVLAGLLMKRGGHGLKPDIFLGLVGSIGMSWIFRAIGMFPNAGIVAMAFVAFIGAALAIVLQRKLRPTEQPGEANGKVWRWGLGAALVAAVGWMILGPSVQPAATATSVGEDKTYAVTPAAMKVKAGIVTGEVTAMKVTERVEQGSRSGAHTSRLS